jgi:hypothetical protein
VGIDFLGLRAAAFTSVAFRDMSRRLQNVDNHQRFGENKNSERPSEII